MSIWFNKGISLESINNWCTNTIHDALNIKITEIGDSFLKGTMPVSHLTVQPQRRLHGGASCVLAESLGSVASNLVVNNKKHVAFGIEINTSHLRPASEGTLVTGKATPIHVGKTLHLWEIKIFNEDEKQVSQCQLRTAIVAI